MLLALGFRGVSFEFRVQSKEHRRGWDVAFGVGSLVAALMQGLVVGGLMQGVTVQDRHFAGSVPVSYTHLDVYKRQVLGCAAADRPESGVRKCHVVKSSR